MSPEIAVAIFGRNEAASIEGCLTHLLAAQAGRSVQIDVILNGTTDDSAARARAVLSRLPAARLWGIPHADKSNAINQYFYHIRPAATCHVFVDAYARVAPASLTALAAALDSHPGASAAAALPASGRSAPATRAAMLKTPGIHGSLFALRSSFVDRLVAAGFRLPVNLYRGDGLIGSMVAHDLDAKNGAWEPSRTVIAADASWTFTPLSPFSIADIRRQLHRMVRQQRGRLESEAIKSLIYGPEGGYAALDGNADRMVTDWLTRFPERRPAWRTNPFGALAARWAARAVAPREEQLRPEILK